MSYVRNNLIPGEEIEAIARIHWVVYAKPIFTLIVAALVAFVAPPFYPPTAPGAPNFQSIAYVVAGVLSLFALLGFVKAWIVNWTTEVALTNKRIIGKVGLIQRDTVELNLNKVESLFVDQSILGRLLGFGIVRVRGTGGSEFRAADIGAPLAFKTAAYAALDRYRDE